MCADLDRLAPPTLDIKKTLNGLLTAGALGPEGNAVVSHDAKAEEYQVLVPQRPLAKLQEGNERLASSVSNLH